jgi:hypothetical protein
MSKESIRQDVTDTCPQNDSPQNPNEIEQKDAPALLVPEQAADNQGAEQLQVNTHSA